MGISEAGAGRLWAAVRRQGVLLSEALAVPETGEVPLARSSRAWVRLLPHVLGFAAAAALLPTGVVVLLNDYGLPGGLAGPLGAASAAPLLLAAARPLAAWYIVFCANVLTALALLVWADSLGDQAWPWPPPAIIGYLLLCLPLALRRPRRTTIAVWLVTVVAAVLLGLLSPGRSPGSNVLFVVLSGVVLLLGGAVRERSEAQHTTEVERARRTLLEERARIARELHDVVAHHMSVITVQADSAPYRIEGVPEAARAEFAAIAGTARQSLAEMRRLLGVLRSESSGGDPQLAPQPGLGELDALVESAVRAGVAARLTVSGVGGEHGELPQAVTLSAYRIVQEALANVVRHAPGAEAAVTVAVDADRGALRVEIVNGPASAPARPLEAHGTGHGLIGMRERTRLVGGTLDTGRTADGGFRVAAVLPLDGTTPGETA
ncbi:histidine kinase [Streptomyces sp. XM4011]|uniref:sensor histidine kinase n=1 Tax=Streptomyces TaxID=1883 RepID=UPI001FFA1C7D|nr:histidine kinase [Streptomyces sp. XM4011]MCK1814147.1 histidine kinase [Streptomyces sp. XM4011]